MHNPVDSAPLIAILGLPSDDAEALEDVDDVVDASPLHAQLPCALVQQEQVLLILAIDAQESATELAK